MWSVVLLCFVAFCSAIEPVDLLPLIYGPSNDYPSGGELYYQLEDTWIWIDLALMPIEFDELWEATVHSTNTPSDGSNLCNWALGYQASNGVNYQIRAGNIGEIHNIGISGDFEDYPLVYPISSSSIVWLRGRDIPASATKLYIRVDNCDIARYITRWKFEAWNGQAYLLDLSGPSHFRLTDDGQGPGPYRLSYNYDHDWDYTATTLGRDNSIYDAQFNYWTFDDLGNEDGEVLLDLHTAFDETVNDFSENQPILELLWYTPPGDGDEGDNYIDFEVADEEEAWDANGAGEMPVNAESSAASFTRLFFNYALSLADDLGDEEIGFYNFAHLTLAPDDEVEFAVLPYGRLWDPSKPVGDGPIWVNLGHRGDTRYHARTDGCVDYTSDLDSDEDGIFDDHSASEQEEEGFTMFGCAYGSGLEWVIDERIAAMNNPFLVQTFFIGALAPHFASYNLIDNDKEVTTLTNVHYWISEEQEGYEITMGYVDEFVNLANAEAGNSLRLANDLPGAAYIVYGRFPVYEGPKDRCVDNDCGGNGTCFNYLGRAVCDCDQGWTGPADSEIASYGWYNTCDTRISFTGMCPEETNPCMNDGICDTDNDGSLLCYCTGPYTGTFCEELIDPCPLPTNPCQNDGVCKDDGAGNAICQCPGHTTGSFCQYETCGLSCESQRESVIAVLDNMDTINDIVELVGGMESAEEIPTDFRYTYRSTLLHWRVIINVFEFTEQESLNAIEHFITLFSFETGVECDLVLAEREDDRDEDTLVFADVPEFVHNDPQYEEQRDYYHIWVYVPIEGQTNGLDYWQRNNIPDPDGEDEASTASTLAACTSLFMVIITLLF